MVGVEKVVEQVVVFVTVAVTAVVTIWVRLATTQFVNCREGFGLRWGWRWR